MANCGSLGCALGGGGFLDGENIADDDNPAG